MKVNSKEAAWNEANKIFPTDYELDQHRSENAGYGIYFSTADGINAWISDLGDRLEVNLPDGSSVNIWVMNPKKQGVCTEVHTYNRFGKQNSQHDLQILAKSILDNGTIAETIHHGYSRCEPGKEPVFIENGSIAHRVVNENFPMMEYIIHMTGFTVDEIIETIRKECK